MMHGSAVGLLIRVAVLAIVASLAVACTNVAMSGAQAVYNHKHIEKSVTDTYITMQATHAINRPSYKGTSIDIATLNGEVLLSGEAPEAWQKEDAARRIERIDGVQHVYNMIRISNPASPLVRASDAWVTTKVKSQLIASNDLDATKIKVVTSNGRVFLMGTVLPEEADAAVDIASNTGGVTSVVKMFSYIKISKKL
jgi:osmotically-inducible protein OsmY